MANDSVTLALDGEVRLEDFAVAMQHFRRLVDGLTRAVGEKSPVTWVLENLSYSSAVVTARAESTNETAVETIAHAYLTVGRSLQNREVVPYAASVRTAAESLVGLLDGRITSVRFETIEADAVIRKSPQGRQYEPLPLITAFGAVEGLVQTLSNRKGLRFALYDLVFDKAVSCYLRGDDESIMRDVWGRRAVVEGFVSRDPETGRAVSIRDVSHVELVPDVTPGAYLRARGILPLRDSPERPEQTIRRLRDA